MADTNRLVLPLLAASQAQKHVTMNEALKLLDAIIQSGVVDKDLTSPPGSPSDGDIYIVGASATGDWATHDDDLAIYQDGAWVFVTPVEGFLSWVEDEAALYVFTSGSWSEWSSAGFSTALSNGTFTLLGINGATADATHRLSLKSPGALFDNVGGDQAMTQNKAATGDDAGYYLQVAYSTRALYGLLGNDNFTIKVTPDGSTFYDGIIIDKDNGAVELTQHPKFSAYLNYGNNYTAGSWQQLLFNNTRHNDQSSFASNVFTAPHDGYYAFGAGATFETPGTIPTKMQIGLSVNGATPTSDTIDTTGDATITSLETAVATTGLLKLTAGDTVEAQIFFTTNNGRVAADLNYFWGHQAP